MNKASFILFFSVFLALYGFIHIYIYWNISSGLSLGADGRLYLKAIIIMGALSFFADKLISRKVFIYPLAWTGALWFGIISIAVTILLLNNIMTLIFCSQAKATTMGSLGAILLIVLISLYNAAGEPKVREVAIRLKECPESLKGFSIVQLSDLHLDDIKTERWLSTVVDKTNALGPDLVVFTGDLIDRPVRRDYSRILKRLEARYGVIAVTGNHDFYTGIDKYLEFAEKSGIEVLRNRSKVIAGMVLVSGVDDDAADRFGGEGCNIAKVLEGSGGKMPVILLSHQPGCYDESEKAGVDLQLSGHLHSGQIPPYNFIVHAFNRFAYGLDEYKSMYIYVTSGTGTWSPTMRFLSSSEIVVFRLS